MIKRLVLAAILLLGSLAPSSAQFLMRSYVASGAAGGGTPAVDGTTAAAGVSLTLTTTQSNDVIIVAAGGTNISTAGAGLTVSGCSLSWTQKSFANDTISREVQLWYAVAASPLSGARSPPPAMERRPSPE